MINEEMEYYTEDGSSELNNGDSQNSDDMAYGEEEEYCKYQKEQIFQEVDLIKRKTKIACTMG